MYSYYLSFLCILRICIIYVSKFVSFLCILLIQIFLVFYKVSWFTYFSKKQGQVSQLWTFMCYKLKWKIKIRNQVLTRNIKKCGLVDQHVITLNSKKLNRNRSCVSYRLGVVTKNKNKIGILQLSDVTE